MSAIPARLADGENACKPGLEGGGEGAAVCVGGLAGNMSDRLAQDFLSNHHSAPAAPQTKKTRTHARTHALHAPEETAVRTRH